jgi:hypothetical protein
MELEKLERKYKELGEEIERIKESKPEECWYTGEAILQDTVAYKAYLCNASEAVKEACIRQSNAFPTELEAARMAERFNLELEISKFIKDNHGEVDWSDRDKIKYTLNYANDRSTFNISDRWCQYFGYTFNSYDLANKAIEIYGQRLKFAWGITDER